MERNAKQGVNKMSKINYESDEIRIQKTLTRAARGDYQRRVLAGYQRPSGADLRGKAKSCAMRYAHSRCAVIGRANRMLRWEFDGPKYQIVTICPKSGPHYYALENCHTGETRPL